MYENVLEYLREWLEFSLGFLVTLVQPKSNMQTENWIGWTLD